MEVKLLNYNKFDGFSSQKRALGSGTSCGNNEPAHYKRGAHILKEDNSKDINKIRPAESVSFSGSAVSKSDKEKKDEKFNKLLLAGGAIVTAVALGGLILAHGAKKGKLNPTGENMSFTEKLARSKTFHKMAYYSEDNEAQIKALLALGLAGVLKPLCVLAMPGAEKEDKQFTATKNALSAFIGYLLSCAVLNPISSGVNEFLDNPAKYLKNKGGENNWLVQTFNKEAEKGFTILPKDELKRMKADAIKKKEPFYYADMKPAFKTVYKNGLGVLVAPAKAALTIAFMPFVLKFVFGDSKGKKKEKEQENKPLPMEILTNSTLTAVNKNNIDKIFDRVAKGGLQK